MLARLAGWLKGSSPWLAPEKGRIELVDICRGSFFLMMTSSHALSLAGLSRAHPVVRYGLPLGWATVGFITLSGLAISLLYGSAPSLKTVAQRLARRSFEIFTVMFVSNVVFLLLKYATQHRLEMVNDRWFWLGLFTFRTNYSISAILIPTAMLLLLAPLVLFGRRTLGSIPVLVICAALSVAIAVLTSCARQAPDLPRILDLLLVRGIGGFKPLQLICFGMIGMSLGGALTSHCSRRAHVTLLALFPTLYVVCKWLRTSHSHLVFGWLYRAGVGPARLCFTLAALIAARAHPSLRTLVSPLGTIGRYALLSFVMHRILLHAVLVLFHLLGLSAAPLTTYLLLFVATVICIWTTCAYRGVHPGYHRALAKIFL